LVLFNASLLMFSTTESPSGSGDLFFGDAGGAEERNGVRINKRDKVTLATRGVAVKIMLISIKEILFQNRSLFNIENSNYDHH